MSNAVPPRARRRWVRWTVAAALLVVLGFGAWLAVGLLGAARETRSQAAAAQDSLSQAATALADGDVPAARAAVDEGRASVSAATQALQAPQVSVTGALPVVGQAVTDARALASAAGHAVDAAGAITDAYAAAKGADGAEPLFANGAVDRTSLDAVLAGVTAADEQVAAAQAELDTVQATLPGTGALAQARDDARSQLDSLQGGLDAVAAAAPALPAALGFDGPRTYLVPILNSAELRASGGAPLAAAILRFDQGRLTVVDRGQTGGDLIPGFHPRVRFTGSDGTPRYDLFINAIAPADFRDAGVDLTRSWKASTGQPVDGIITLDPVALAAVLKATGPIDVPGYGTVSADTFVQQVLVDAYENFAGEQGDRQQLNIAALDAMTQRLVSGGDTLAVLRALSSETGARHVQAWFADPALQGTVEQSPLGGALAAPDPHADRVAVFSQNVNRSKVDVFQERTVTTDVQLAADGGATAREVVRVGNDSPRTRRDDRRRGYTTGWSRNTYRIYLPEAASDVQTELPPDSVTLPEQEDPEGRRYLRVVAWIPPRQQIDITVRYSLPPGTFTRDGDLHYVLLADPQALIRPATLSVTVTAPEGWTMRGASGLAPDGTVATWTGPFDQPLRFTADAVQG